jgi:hypothetical protein
VLTARFDTARGQHALGNGPAVEGQLTAQHQKHGDVHRQRDHDEQRQYGDTGRLGLGSRLDRDPLQAPVRELRDQEHREQARPRLAEQDPRPPHRSE